MTRGAVYLRLLAVVSLLCLAPTHARAQAAEWPIGEGDVVRLLEPNGAIRAQGLVVRVDADSIVLAVGGARGTLAARLSGGDTWALRRRVGAGERVRGRGSRGAFLGASIGGIAAPFLVPGEDEGLSTARGVLIGAGAGAVLGGVIGAVVGLLFPQHEWQRFQIRG